MMDDLISRQATIEQSIVLRDISNPDKEWEVVTVGTIKHLKSVQPAQKWIPVSERLPEEDGEYLVTTINGDVDVYVFHTWGAKLPKVVAWMPLPEPYKAEGSEADADCD